MGLQEVQLPLAMLHLEQGSKHFTHSELRIISSSLGQLARQVVPDLAVPGAHVRQLVISTAHVAQTEAHGVQTTPTTTETSGGHSDTHSLVAG